MNQDISDLLNRNLPAAPDSSGFGPKARGIRLRRQVIAGVAVVAVLAVPVGWAVTQLPLAGKTNRDILATPSPTRTSSAQPTQTNTPQPTQTNTPEPIQSPTQTNSQPSTQTNSQPPTQSSSADPSTPSTGQPGEPVISAKPTQFFNYKGEAKLSSVTVEFAQAHEGIGPNPNFEVKVCLTKPINPAADGTSEISIDAWKLTTADAKTYQLRPGNGGPAYPAQAKLKVGQCAQGFLQTPIKVDDFGARVSYQNSVGDSAVWALDGPWPGVNTKPASSDQIFGNQGKAKFENFTVELKSRSIAAGKTPNFEVEVCYTKATNSSSNSRVSVDPWYLTANDGKPFYRLSPSTDHTPAFPKETELKVGQCVSGFLEAKVANEAAPVQLLYSNSLGNRASWVVYDPIP